MIRLDEAYFSFSGKPILEGASLFVPEGSRFALVGPNGAGKTTLFRLVLGELRLESGKLAIPRQRRIAFLPQHPALPPGETILRHVLESHATLRDTQDEILHLEEKMGLETDAGRLDRLVERHRNLSRDFEARGGYEIEARVSRILDGLGFKRQDLLREIGPLSPGEKNRIALAKVLLAEADILLLDEPTNHLDFSMVEWLEDFLRSPPRGDGAHGPSVLVASHDRSFLNRVAEHICELRGGQLFTYPGNYDDFARQRSEELERQAKEYRLQQADVAHDLDFIRRNFAGQKARQAKSREKKLERLEIVERPERGLDGPRIRFDGVTRGGDDVLRLEDVDCGYDGTPILQGVHLELERGERVAILGPNGCGKTTLLKCLAGRLGPLRGRVKLGARTVVGYYEQDVSHQGSDRSIFEELHDLVPLWTNRDVFDLLARFLFRGDDINLRTRDLSGGEKARFAILRLIISGPNLLLLDEPTNHLDIYARAALEESLLEFTETIVFVSHDRFFVERVADRVLAIGGSGLEEYTGGYEEYRRAWRDEAAGLEAKTASDREARRRERTSRQGTSGEKGDSAPRSRREEKLVRSISLAEERLREKQAACGEESNYRNPEAMRRLKEEIRQLEEGLAELYRRWESSEY